MDQAAVQIPTSFYVIIGILVIGNISVLITVITFIFKAGFFVSETKMGIENVKEISVRAHKRIDLIEARGRV